MTPEFESLVVIEPWKTVWPNAIAAVMALAGAVGLRRQLRPDAALLAILALALLARVVLVPIGQHQFDGHEAEYLDLWMGRRALTQGGTLLYPAMQWLYAGLGRVLPWEQGPVVVSLAASLLSIAALKGLVERLYSREAALVGAGVMVLWGNHIFWSSSAYNVMLPHALSLVALWALACWSRGAPPWASGLLAGGCAALAVGMRLESILVAPLGLALLALFRPRGWAGVLGLLGGVVLGSLSAWYVLLPGHPPGSGQRAIAFAMNVGLLDYFAPFNRPVSWLLFALALCLALRKSWRLPAVLTLFAIGTHLASATFDDYGFRHLLTAGAALAAVLGALVTLPVHGRWPALGLLGGLLVWDALDVRERYYATEQAFEASLPELPVWGLDDLGECTLICEDHRVVPEGEQLSHFNLLDEDEHRRMAEEGCIHWLVGVQDHRWSSRAVRDRALRLQALYELESRAVVKDPASGYVGWVVEVGERRTPRPWNLSPSPGI